MSTVATLRDLVPIRPLDRIEAMRIAELQAQRLLELVGIYGPPVPDRIITELPFIQVERLTPLPVSGAARWASQRWVILLNGAESRCRQRFSLAHELKHILDHRFVAVIYGSIPASERQQAIERICDYFAGCLLMPRTWLTAQWLSGKHSTRTLASLFDTSELAIRVRLQQIGELEPLTRRCSSDWSTRPYFRRVNTRRRGSQKQPLAVTKS